jgi:hypothetical protein
MSGLGRNEMGMFKSRVTVSNSKEPGRHFEEEFVASASEL